MRTMNYSTLSSYHGSTSSYTKLWQHTNNYGGRSCATASGNDRGYGCRVMAAGLRHRDYGSRGYGSGGTAAGLRQRGYGSRGNGSNRGYGSSRGYGNSRVAAVLHLVTSNIPDSLRLPCGVSEALMPPLPRADNLSGTVESRPRLEQRQHPWFPLPRKSNGSIIMTNIMTNRLLVSDQIEVLRCGKLCIFTGQQSFGMASAKGCYILYLPPKLSLPTQ